MKKTHCDISFHEKARIFSHDYLKACVFIHTVNVPKYRFTKKLYLELITSSQMLEDFLDFHGAKNNTDWYYYRELCAAVRHLSLAGYSQIHIANRLSFYDLDNTKGFEKQSDITLGFIKTSLMKMAPVIINEARTLGIRIPSKGFDSERFPGIATSETLDFNIDDENKDLEKKNIVMIASEFLKIAGDFDQFRFYEPYSIEEIMTIVPDKVNEVVIRRVEMLVHNLQSSFDTYVIHGGYQHGNRKLKALRGYFSSVFHLLQIIGRLLHFYERHLFEAGYKSIYQQVQHKLGILINPEMLLDRIINYGLYYVCHYLSNGRDLAREILNENIERAVIKVGIPQKLGFHARPSLLVAKIIQHYGGQVEMCVGENRFDAGSVLDIQWAGGMIQKENIKEVVLEGDTRALKDIKILAGVNYGEDTMGKGIALPKELNYLK